MATHVALRTHADTLKSGGDERTLGQIMADTLVERITGMPAGGPAPITLDVLISSDTLFRAGDEPAHMIGYGPLPAPLARDLATGNGATATVDGQGQGQGDGHGEGDGDDQARVFLRRLFTDPDDGALVAMESTARLFPENLRRFLIVRDQTCRTPWCAAPIRHGDHVLAHAGGGATSAANGQGLCAACNQAKQAPDWAAAPDPIAGAGVGVIITTPTGHTYTSTPPPPPRGRAPAATKTASTTKTVTTPASTTMTAPASMSSTSPPAHTRRKPSGPPGPGRAVKPDRPGRRPRRLAGYTVHRLTWEQLLSEG